MLTRFVKTMMSQLDDKTASLLATFECPATLRKHACCSRGLRTLGLRVGVAALMLQLQTENEGAILRVLRCLRSWPVDVLESYTSSLLICVRSRNHFIRDRALQLVLSFDTMGEKYLSSIAVDAIMALNELEMNGHIFHPPLERIFDSLHGHAKWCWSAALVVDDTDWLLNCLMDFEKYHNGGS